MASRASAAMGSSSGPSPPVKPDVCVRRWCSVISRLSAGTPSKNRVMGSSTESSPRCSSRRIAAAVMGFVMEAMSCTVVGV